MGAVGRLLPTNFNKRQLPPGARIAGLGNPPPHIAKQTPAHITNIQPNHISLPLVLQHLKIRRG